MGVRSVAIFVRFPEDFGRAEELYPLLIEASLVGTNLTGANLTGANLTGVYLMEANLTGASLNLATLSRTELKHANFGGASLGMTVFLDIDLDPLCDADPPVTHSGPSTVDFRSIVSSIRSPNLLAFLQQTGMPEVFAEFMVDCARAMDGSMIKKLLRSTFISYGGPDEAFARRLYEALHRNGVTTFFFPEHAKPGQRIGRVVRENVESYDRILLLCSEAALDRPGVQFEIEETLERERRDGGVEYLIPVLLDDHLLSTWKPARSDVARTLRDRVCADFRGAQEDEAVFNAGLRRLIAALRPPDVALWQPPGAPKPSET